MQRKLTLFLTSLIFLLLFLSSGCRDGHDVDELAMVIGIGIDRISGTEPILVTAEIVNPSATKNPGAESGSTQEPYITLTGRGTSLEEAIRELDKTTSRKLFFAHNKIIVLSKNLMASDISDIVDFVQRDREFRRTNQIVIAAPSAKEVLETKTDIEKFPAFGIFSKLIAKDQTAVCPVNLNEFVLNSKNDICVCYAPLINIEDLNQENKISGIEKKDNQMKNSKLNLESMAIFKNNCLVGILTPTESKGFLWLLNKLKEDTIIIPDQTVEGIGKTVLDIREVKTKIVPHIVNNEVTMEIICTGLASIRNSSALRISLKDPQMYQPLEQAAANILKSQIEQTITCAQRNLKVDFLGFGNKIHNENPVEWNHIKNNWDQLFPDIKYSITFQLAIIKSGTTKNSVTIKKEGS